MLVEILILQLLDTIEEAKEEILQEELAAIDIPQLDYDPYEEQLLLHTILQEAEDAKLEEERRQEEARRLQEEQRAAEAAAREAAVQQEDGSDNHERPNERQQQDVAVTTSLYDKWYPIAKCESGYGGEPQWGLDAFPDRGAYSDARYYGGLQFNKSSWDWAGGQKYAYWPHHATAAQQIDIAERLLAIHPASWGAWPVCSRKVGYR